MAAAVAIVATAGIAYAEEAVVPVAPGPLTFTGADATFGTVTLDGTTQTVSTSSVWTVSDARGTTAGWNVTVSVDGDLTASTVESTIPRSGFRVRLPDANITTSEGASDSGPAPSSLVTGMTVVPLDAAPLTLISAPAALVDDEGVGSYDLEPEFEIDVPPTAKPALHRAILTITLNAAP